MLQSLWNEVLDRFGTNYVTYHAWGSIILVNGIFFLFGGLFVLMDLTGRPKSWQKYKTQPNMHDALNWPKFRSLLITVLINQFVIGSIFMFGTAWLHLKIHGHPEDLSVLPSLSEFLFQMTIFTLIEEVLFFYAHWAFHHRSIYKYIHKKHHEWTAPIAFEAVYAHPIEHLISNLMPASVGPLLFNSHVLVTLFYFSLITFVTVCHHSGYHLPLLPSPQAHDFHHMTFNQNYGALGIFDYIHGTDQGFRKHVAFQRHHTLFTTKSAQELHPDPNSTGKQKLKEF